MHQIDMNTDPDWYAKLKENRAEAQRDPRVQAVQAWAADNYEVADVIVEACEPDEILRDIVDDAATPAQAVNKAKEYVGLRRSVENDVRGYGGLPPLSTL